MPKPKPQKRTPEILERLLVQGLIQEREALPPMVVAALRSERYKQLAKLRKPIRRSLVILATTGRAKEYIKVAKGTDCGTPVIRAYDRHRNPDA